MRLEIKMLIVLTLIALISGGVLGLTYIKTSPRIEKNLELAKEKALKKVVPGVAGYEVKELDRYTTLFVAKDSSDRVVGYGVLIQGSGFQGPIKLMVGFDTTCTKLTGLEVIENVETPGLGNRITESWFREQFKGRIPPIQVVKGKKPENAHEIQAITGATISSRSVVRIVNMAQSKLITAIGARPSPTPADSAKQHGTAEFKPESGGTGVRSHKVANSVKKSAQKPIRRQKHAPDTLCVKYMRKFLSRIANCRRLRLPDSTDVFVAYGDHGIEAVGPVVQGTGFMDRIKLIVVMDPNDFHIIGVDVLEMAEGEAFGKGRDSTFWSQFVGVRLPVKLRGESDTSGIGAISGATETSNAVVSLVNIAKLRAEEALEAIKG